MQEDQKASHLEAPAVASAEYDEAYYLNSCIGSDEWRESEGRSAAGIYAGALALAELQPGEQLLDIGTGRGDMLPVAIRAGASSAIGIDYSEAAVRLARRTLEQAGDPPAAKALLADARRIPIEDHSVDLVTMLDVVEHLMGAELKRSLSEAHRALRPGGRIFIHTAPNRWIYTVTYRLQRLIWPRGGSSWPANPRNDHERRLHVNEQSRVSLRRVLLDAGFSDVSVWLGQWVHTDFLPSDNSRRLYRLGSRLPVLRWLTVADLFATGKKPT